MDRSFQDLKHAFRFLRQRPALTLMVAVSLGAGIGVSTATFSVMDAVLLNPFPYAEPDRLVLIWGSKTLEVRKGIRARTLQEWQARSSCFEAIAPFQLTLMPASLGVQTDSIRAAFVGLETFSVLGVRPLMGRVFSKLEGEPGTPKVTVLSYGLWKSAFGGNSAIVGSTIRINEEPYAVIGVMPDRFFFPDRNAQLWLPLTEQVGFFDQVHGLARLRQGVSVAQAQAQFQALTKHGTEGKEAGREEQAGLFSFRRVLVEQYAMAFLTLLGATVSLILLACANVSNLLLAHGPSRGRDLAVRCALGARSSDIFRLLILESVLLGLFGALVGLAGAYVGIRVLQNVGLTDMIGLESASLNHRVLLFAILLSLVSGLICGIFPAWKTSRSDLRGALQTGEASSQTPSQNQLRESLVCMEVAIALVLLATSGLMLRSFFRLTAADWGFNRLDALIVQVRLPRDMWWNPRLRGDDWIVQNRQAIRGQVEFAATACANLRSIAEVTSAAAARDVPLARMEWAYRPLAANGQMLTFRRWPLISAVGQDFFKTLGIAVIRGREFGPYDDNLAPRVTVINRKLAGLLWPGQDPIGKNLSILELDERRPDVIERKRKKDPKIVTDLSVWKQWGGGPREVVGVVENTRMIGLDRDAEPTVYVDIRQSEIAMGQGLVFAIHLRESHRATVDKIKEAIRTVNSGVSIERVVSMQQLVNTSIGGQGTSKLLVLVSSLFGTLSLVLVVTGVYSVVCHSVTKRTREFGIRIALGARRMDVLLLVVRNCMRSVAWGVGLGIFAALGITRLFESLLFGVTPTDPLTFFVATTLLVASTLAACLVPSLKWRGDPASLLRHE